MKRVVMGIMLLVSAAGAYASDGQKVPQSTGFWMGPTPPQPSCPDVNDATMACREHHQEVATGLGIDGCLHVYCFTVAEPLVVDTTPSQPATTPDRTPGEDR